MQYQCWYYRGGALVVEKYAGQVEADQVLDNDEEFLSRLEGPVDTLMVLSDLSEITFINLAIEEIAELFASFDKHLPRIKKIKLALYTGMSNNDLFQKVVSYSNHGNKRRMSAIPFVHLDMAMEWLGLSPAEQEAVREQLGNTSS